MERTARTIQYAPPSPRVWDRQCRLRSSAPSAACRISPDLQRDRTRPTSVEANQSWWVAAPCSHGFGGRGFKSLCEHSSLHRGQPPRRSILAPSPADTGSGSPHHPCGRAPVLREKLSDEPWTVVRYSWEKELNLDEHTHKGAAGVVERGGGEGGAEGVERWRRRWPGVASCQL